MLEEDSTRPESGFAFYLHEPALVTLGVCYEKVPSFGGGVYHPILRRLETFTDDPLRAAIKDHEKRATIVLDLEERVATAVKKLKERGLVSPYLRSFVVARINPLRWIKGDPPGLEDVLKTMRERAAKFYVEKIRPQDLAGTGGPPDEKPDADDSLRSCSRLIAFERPCDLITNCRRERRDLPIHEDCGPLVCRTYFTNRRGRNAGSLNGSQS